MTASRGRPAPDASSPLQPPSRAATALALEGDEVNLGPLSESDLSDDAESTAAESVLRGAGREAAPTVQQGRRRSPSRSDLDFLTDSLAAAYEPNGNPWG